MKCNNCGAPIQLDQKFCPNCGSPNEQGLKHANDMENYNKKFNRTRSKVISNSKWFVKNITPIAVVMLSAIVLAAALIANNSMFGYRVTERDNKRYNKTHNDEIQVQLKESTIHGEDHQKRQHRNDQTAQQRYQPQGNTGEDAHILNSSRHLRRQ